VALTLDDLLSDVTADDWRAQLYAGLQGLGFTAYDGAAFGAVGVTGVPNANYTLAVKIASYVGSGNVVGFQYSLDGGGTYSSVVSSASDGTYAITQAGVTVVFVASAQSPIFSVGDVYTIELLSPTLPTTSWEEGSTPRTLVDNNAAVLEDLSRKLKRIVAGGFLEYAFGGWLDLWGQSMYGLTRNPGRIAQGNVVLTETAGQGPTVINAGQLTFRSDSGLRYTNTAGGTLTALGTLSLPVSAEAVGTAYNVPVGTLKTLLTPLPGVTANNPGTSGVWLTTQGLTRESDAEYKRRCKARWPGLGESKSVSDVYFLWATTASDQVTRVQPTPSVGTPGRLDIYIAGVAGALSSGVVSAVQSYIDPRAPFGTTPVVQSATNRVLNVTGTVYVETAQLAAAQAQVASNVLALQSGGTTTVNKVLPGIPIGGTVYASTIVDQIQDAVGVRNVTLTGPADTTLGANEVAVLPVLLNYVGV